jgi:hypothetical protein
MEDTEKPHMGKYKEITNEWNYDASCMLTSLLFCDLEIFTCLIFVVQCVQEELKPKSWNKSPSSKLTYSVAYIHHFIHSDMSLSPLIQKMANSTALNLILHGWNRSKAHSIIMLMTKKKKKMIKSTIMIIYRFMTV